MLLVLVIAILVGVARGGQGAILRVWDQDLRRNLAMKVSLETTNQIGIDQTDARLRRERFE